jgi:hypothetical protein
MIMRLLILELMDRTFLPHTSKNSLHLCPCPTRGDLYGVKLKLDNRGVVGRPTVISLPGMGEENSGILIIL